MSLNKIYPAIILLFISATVNAQWIQIPSAPTGYVNNISSYQGVLYLSHFSNGIYKSEDGGLSWMQIISGLNNNQSKSVTEIYSLNEALYAATVDGIYKSTDLGNNWVKKSSGITIGPGALSEFCESIYEYNGVLFTGAWNGIYRSTDGAETWTVTNVTGQGINAKNFVEHNGILFAARESINFPNGYFSTDSGQTWNALTSLNFPTITFLSEGIKLWAGTIHGVWLSTDDGLTWQARSDGLSPDPYSSSILRVNGNLVTSLKFGGSGMFRSSDEGLSWEDWGNGLPFLNTIEKLIVFNDKVLAATSDGIWYRDTVEVISGLDHKSDFAVNYRLQQNYPNPFNPSTTINFTIPAESFVSLKIFNSLGEEVETLVAKELSAGNYKYDWNAKNLPSGIYYYKLQSESFIETKKMLLLK